MCSVPQDSFFSAGTDMKPCTTRASTKCMMEYLRVEILDYDLDETWITGCQRPCQETTYPVTVIEELSVPGALTGYYFYFSDMSYTLYDEVLLYDSNQILAGVGGSLGLFLGFSCRGFLVDLLLYVRSICKADKKGGPGKKVHPEQQ